MSREINFLSERRKTLSKQEAKDKRLLRIALIFLAIVIVALLGCIGGLYYFNSQLAKVKSLESAARTEILSNADTEQSFVLFVRKLSSLAAIAQDRQDKRNVIDYFNQVFGPDVLIKGLEFDPKNKLLLFKIESPDVFKLRAVLDLVNSPDIQAKFVSLNPSDLSRTSDGKYEMSLAVSTQMVATPSGAIASPSAAVAK